MALTEKLSAIGQAIRDMTGKTEMLTLDAMPGEIRSIEGGGGSSADVRYVTFMSYDGTVEYGKKAVAVGDDCADPIVRGVFETPIRESDVQYNYTFAGWATTVNGPLDSNALKAVTEDRTVYANYISTVRVYTITYYDSNGTTVLKTESLAYGATPSYMPMKDGYSFDRWNPTLATVTGDASYTALWIEKITFAGSSWADIARVSEAGEAKDYFKIGDSRVVPVTIGGTTYQFTAKIVGFDHDEMRNGTKAGISCMFFTVNATKTKLSAAPTSSAYSYMETGLWRAATNYITYVPTELKDVVKAVKKSYNYASKTTEEANYDQMWLPSISEISINGVNQYGYVTESFGELYEAFNTNYYGYSNKSPATTVYDTNGSRITSEVWVRDMITTANNYYAIYMGSQGSAFRTGTTSGEYYLPVGFCI